MPQSFQRPQAASLMTEQSILYALFQTSDLKGSQDRTNRIFKKRIKHNLCMLKEENTIYVDANVINMSAKYQLHPAVSEKLF